MAQRSTPLVVNRHEGSRPVGCRSKARLRKVALITGEIMLLASGCAATQWPNPSVKGTSTSGLRPLAAAPYVER
jgi:hypothetical protein